LELSKLLARKYLKYLEICVLLKAIHIFKALILQSV